VPSSATSSWTATSIYTEASGAGGGPAALSQGLSPLEGIVVPTLGAYDIAATLLFPFVVIRLIANEKQTGALALTLQSPLPFAATMAAKLLALLAAWLVAGLAGAIALVTWRGVGGHLYGPETMTVVLGHVLRGLLTIGVSAAAAALATSAASAAIVALTVTLGTWALDYVAAARGGVIASVAAYTPSAALRVFEHGELRVATLLILVTLGVGGLVVATVWLREGEQVSRRVRDVVFALVAIVALCIAFARVRDSRDVSEDRRKLVSRRRRSGVAHDRRAAPRHGVPRGGGPAPGRPRAWSARQAAAHDERGRRHLRGARTQWSVRAAGSALWRDLVSTRRPTRDDRGRRRTRSCSRRSTAWRAGRLRRPQTRSRIRGTRSPRA
jgi:hypothetical protein